MVPRTLLLLQATAGEALVNPECGALRNGIPQTLNFLSSEALSKVREKEVVAQSKSLGTDQAGARVLRREGSHNCGRLALGVHLRVVHTGGENSHLVGTKIGVNDSLLALCISHSELWDGFDKNVPRNNGESLSCTRMDMERCHSASYHQLLDPHLPI